MNRFHYVLMILLSLVMLASVQVQAQDDQNFLPPSQVITADNVNQLQEVATLGLGEIYNAAYSPNGQEVAIASATGLSVYSIYDWSRPTKVIKNDGARVAVAFTEDGKSLVTYPTNDVYWLPPERGDLKLYDLTSGKTKILITDFTKSINKIAVDPQGRWIATVEQECKNWFSGMTCGTDTFSIRDVRIRIWDMTSGNLLQTITPNAYISDLAFQPHTSSLVYFRRYGVEDTDDLVFWDVDAGKQVNAWQFDHNKYSQFALSGDGQTIGLLLEKAGKWYVHVDFLDVQTQTIRSSLEVSSAALKEVGFYYDDSDYDFAGRIWLNDDASQVFTQEYTDPGVRFYIWDTKTGLNIFPQTDFYIQDLASSPIDDISIIFQFNGHVFQWDGRSRMVGTLQDDQPAIQSAMLSADDQLIAVEGYRYGHALYNFQTGRRLSLPPNSRPLAISTNSDLIALVVDNQIRIWDRKLNATLMSITLDNDFPLTAKFSPDDSLLAVGLRPDMVYDEQGNLKDSAWQPVHIYAVKTGELLAIEHSYDGRDEHLLFSSDSSLLVTDIGIWNVKEWLASGKVDQQDQPKWLVGSPMALSSDGRLLATISYGDNKPNAQHIIHIFDIQLQKELFVFDRHHGDISALAFNPDGTLLVSASADRDASVRDNSVRLWNMETGKELLTLEIQQNDFMRDVFFSNDGKYIVTAHGGCECESWDINNAIRIWGIPTNGESNP